MRIRLWAAFVFGFGWGLQDKLMIPGPLDILSILYSTIVIEAIQEIGEGSLLAAILVGSTILFGVFLGFYALMELYDEIRGFLINTGFPAAIVIFFAYLSGWGIAAPDNVKFNKFAIFLLIMTPIIIYMFELMYDSRMRRYF